MTEPRINWGDKRVSKRISVALPMLVRGADKHGVAFEDTAASFNVSRDGVSFSTTRDLLMGQEVEVIIPRRQVGRHITDFETRGQVVRIIPKGAGQWEIGLRFVGPRLRTFVPETT